jgi:RHS repeat-associated protein
MGMESLGAPLTIMVFRIYNPGIGRFLSVDPLTTSYPMLTPYQFASNTPIQAIDLDGLEALIITFPEYKADPELKVSVWGKTFKAPKVPSGHAGVLLIEPNGATRYFEYGRYPSSDGVSGFTRKVPLKNDVVFGEDGFPANESLNKVLEEISNKSGDGRPIRAAYVVTSEIQKMLDYAYGKVKENFDVNRKPYSVSSNNCGTFAADCINQDPTVDQPAIYNPTPNNIADEYIEEGNREILYDPKTKTTTVGQGDEDDAKKN